MIQMFHKASYNLREVSDREPGCWINISAPTPAEVDDISRRLNIPPTMLTDPLDEDERARIEVEDDTLLILLRVPYFTSDADVPFRVVPLGIIYSGDFVITVSSRHATIMNDFSNGLVRNFITVNRERFIFQILNRAALLYLNYLKEINIRTENIERELQTAVSNHKLINMQLLGKSLVYFTTSLKANEIMIGRLSNLKMFKVSDDDEEMFADVIVEYRQALEMATVYNNILNGTMDAFASIISNNLNVVMRTLTYISIILMVPTLITSMYGMNIAWLPFAQNPYGLYIIMGASVVVSLLVWFSLRKRKL
ncbi:MAG: magnesium transporter CorA family protein [Victivallaceae bacterium]|nr:magnesium transporter CorA family protein [Victivallaceae bacterium]